MKLETSPTEEFKEVVYESCKGLGLEDFPSRLIALLLSEKDGISLGELSEMTGYSLSNLSTTIKMMEERQMVKKFKKPGSRKVYVAMNKYITTFFIELQKKRYNQSLKPVLEKLPNIIEKYRDHDEFTEEITMIENFYAQSLFLAQETKKFIEALENYEKTI